MGEGGEWRGEGRWERVVSGGRREVGEGVSRGRREVGEGVSGGEKGGGRGG